ncbi:hypothetical protein [Streptomyces sp. NPDC055134]
MNRRPNPMARYIGNGKGERLRECRAVIGDRCLTHAPDREAARRYATRVNVRERLGCLVVLALLAADVVYRSPAAGERMEKQVLWELHDAPRAVCAVLALTAAAIRAALPAPA